MRTQIRYRLRRDSKELGDHLLAYTSIAGIKDGLCAKLAGHATPLRAGESARVHLPPAQCLLFDAAGAAYPRIQ